MPGKVVWHCSGLVVALGQDNCWKGISDRVLLNFWERKSSPCRDLCGSLSLSLFGLFVLSLPVIIVFTYYPTLPIKNDRDGGTLMNHSLGIQVTIINYSSLSLGQWSLRIRDLYISVLRDPLGGGMDSLSFGILFQQEATCLWGPSLMGLEALSHRSAVWE